MKKSRKTQAPIAPPMIAPVFSEDEEFSDGSMQTIDALDQSP
jgi:hypothetical protein